MNRFRVMRYAYDTSKDSNNDITANPTNLTTESESDAIEMCELLQKVYDMGNTRTHNSWFKFGYEPDEGLIIK